MRTSPHGRADLHVHTVWSDGAQRPEAIVGAVQARRDVLVITDHDEIRGALRARQWALARPELGVDVVVGEEISTLNGHLLGLCLEEPPGSPPSRRSSASTARAVSPWRLIRFHPIRGVSRGCASIARMIRDLPLDAVEAVNNAGFFSAPFNAWAALRNLGCDADALRRALLAGRTSAHVDWSWTAGKLPLHLAMQLRAAYRFLRRDRQRVHVDTLP